jgi:geranylgeranyl diphosphate synthase type II
MFDNNEHTVFLLSDVDAEIDRLLMSYPPQVVEAARYHFLANDARVRTQLGLEAATALKLSPKVAIACDLAPELLHNASLIHDDLQEGDEVRRDTPTVWSRYGKDVAISTGDLLISTAYLAIANHPNPAAALGAVHHAVIVTVDGQTQDCRTDCPTPERWATIAALKSGPLFALPICLTLIAARVQGQDTAIRAGNALAVAYQTLDDIDDRHPDLAISGTNICLSLEAAGNTPVAAKNIACDRASAALKAARDHANALPSNAEASLMTLASLLESKLKDIDHAT